MLADLGASDIPALSEARLSDRLAAPSLRHEDRRNLHFALGRVQEQRGAYDDAFVNYEQGNAVQRDLGIRNGFRYEPQERDAQIEKTIRGWTAEYRSSLARHGDPSDAPVFILGLPRSGTTLVEQMLSAHPSVHGSGEHMGLLKIAAEFQQMAGKADGTLSRHVPRALLGSLASRYTGKVFEKAGRARRVIDKNPHNFEQLGLIGALFPNARIIHCRRDAYDTCASIYTQIFHPSHAYATDPAVARPFTIAAIEGSWITGVHLGLPGLYELRYERLVRRP